MATVAAQNRRIFRKPTFSPITEADSSTESKFEECIPSHAKIVGSKGDGACGSQKAADFVLMTLPPNHPPQPDPLTQSLPELPQQTPQFLPDPQSENQFRSQSQTISHQQFKRPPQPHRQSPPHRQAVPQRQLQPQLKPQPQSQSQFTPQPQPQPQIQTPLQPATQPTTKTSHQLPFGWTMSARKIPYPQQVSQPQQLHQPPQIQLPQQLQQSQQLPQPQQNAAQSATPRLLATQPLVTQTPPPLQPASQQSQKYPPPPQQPPSQQPQSHPPSPLPSSQQPPSYSSSPPYQAPQQSQVNPPQPSQQPQQPSQQPLRPHPDADSPTPTPTLTVNVGDGWSSVRQRSIVRSNAVPSPATPPSPPLTLSNTTLSPSQQSAKPQLSTGFCDVYVHAPSRGSGRWLGAIGSDTRSFISEVVTSPSTYSPSPVQSISPLAAHGTPLLNPASSSSFSARSLLGTPPARAGTPRAVTPRSVTPRANPPSPAQSTSPLPSGAQTPALQAVPVHPLLSTYSLPPELTTPRSRPGSRTGTPTPAPSGPLAPTLGRGAPRVPLTGPGNRTGSVTVWPEMPAIPPQIARLLKHGIHGTPKPAVRIAPVITSPIVVQEKFPETDMVYLGSSKHDRKIPEWEERLREKEAMKLMQRGLQDPERLRAWQHGVDMPFSRTPASTRSFSYQHPLNVASQLSEVCTGVVDHREVAFALKNAAEPTKVGGGQGVEVIHLSDTPPAPDDLDELDSLIEVDQSWKSSSTRRKEQGLPPRSIASLMRIEHDRHMAKPAFYKAGHVYSCAMGRAESLIGLPPWLVDESRPAGLLLPEAPVVLSASASFATPHTQSRRSRLRHRRVPSQYLGVNSQMSVGPVRSFLNGGELTPVKECFLHRPSGGPVPFAVRAPPPCICRTDRRHSRRRLTGPPLVPLPLDSEAWREIPPRDVRSTSSSQESIITSRSLAASRSFIFLEPQEVPSHRSKPSRGSRPTTRAAPSRRGSRRSAK